MTETASVLERLGLGGALNAAWTGSRGTPGGGPPLVVRSPIDGHPLATFPLATPPQVEIAIRSAEDAFTTFRDIPAPRRGELVRRLGTRLRERKQDLAHLVTLES